MPAESTFHEQVSTDPAKRWKSYPIVMEQLKEKAKALGLWNLFLSKEHYPDVGVPLTNLEYSVMAEIMGRCPRIAPEACNCSAPDTGNMGSSRFTFPYPLISTLHSVKNARLTLRSDDRGLRSIRYSSAKGQVARPSSRRKDQIFLRHD